VFWVHSPVEKSALCGSPILPFNIQDIPLISTSFFIKPNISYYRLIPKMTGLSELAALSRDFACPKCCNISLFNQPNK